MAFWRKGEKLDTKVTLGEIVWNKEEHASPDEDDEDDDMTELVLGALKEELKEELRAELMQEFMQMFGGNPRPQPKRPVRPQQTPKPRR